MIFRQLTSIFISVLMLTFTLPAQTTTRNVEPGKRVKLVEDKQQIKVTKEPKNGKQEVIQPTDEDRIFKLFYTANDTSEQATDELEYKIDDGPLQKLSINIEPKANDFSPKANQDIFKAVFLLFLLAVVLESALAVIFSWRPFVETFNARAVRPLISFIVAYLFVETFNLDLMTSIVNSATNASLVPGLPGQVLTALVLAGGSAGVNNLLVALGFRQKRTPETATPKPPPTQAWIAIRLDRNQAVGQVQVFLGTPTAGNPRPPLVGIIHGSSKPGIR